MAKKMKARFSTLCPKCGEGIEAGKDITRRDGQWVHLSCPSSIVKQDAPSEFKPSQYQEAWGAAPNLTNLGAETFLAALFSDQWDAPNLSEDRLINMDGDAARKNITALGTRDLFEFSDEWGNPIAYIHRRDYGRSDTYLSYDNETGELLESAVRSLDNPVTKGPYKRRSFQLISAGLDGRFGTPDDICNFERVGD